MRIAAIGWGLAAAWVLGEACAAATTLPDASQGSGGRLAMGVGWGLGGAPIGAWAWDTAVRPALRLGVSAAASPSGLETWSLRGTLRLVEGDANGPSVAALAAVWGKAAGRPLPAVGMALAYAPWPRLSVRAALGYSFEAPSTPASPGFLGLAPCFGFEVGWQLCGPWRLSAGHTGHGEFAGVQALY